MFLFLTTFIFSFKSLARFNHTDANAIDSYPLGSELIIDAKSYEFFESSQYRWNNTIIGYRVSAGSFNAYRFGVTKDIKFTSGSDNAINVSYSLHAEESLFEVYKDEELRIDWAYTNQYYLSLLGDGSTHKKFGDLGIAWGTGHYPWYFLECYYYQVDLYYNTKERLTHDYYSKKPITLGVRFLQNDPLKWTLKGKIEWDRPLIWVRGSLNQVYAYSRRYISIHGRYQLRDQFKVGGSVSYDQKAEFMDFYLMPKYHSGIGRDTSQFNLFILHLDHGYKDFDKIGCQIYLQKAEVFSEGEQNSFKRREVIGYFLRYQPASEINDIYFQWGLYFGYVELDRKSMRFSQGTSVRIEVKMQAAWEFLLGSGGSMVINTNWNIDRIIEHFPYKSQRFLPWNGGNVQFQLKI